jgi:hypothetical protein
MIYYKYQSTSFANDVLQSKHGTKVTKHKDEPTAIAILYIVDCSYQGMCN